MQTNPNCFQQKITKQPLDKYTPIFRKILPIYWAFLTYMLLKPGKENQEYFFMFSGIDKLLHLSIFLLLGLFFLLAFPKFKTTTFFLIMLAYGILTEYLQFAMNMGRAAELLDLIADVLGAGMGFLCYKKFYPQSHH